MTSLRLTAANAELKRMRDRDIRTVLSAYLSDRYGHEVDAVLVQEFSLYKARADLAVLNGAIHGYEIKSEHDTLERLPSQLQAYERVFDFLTVVSGPRYTDKLLKMLPSWAGLLQATSSPAGIDLVVVREERPNPNQQPLALAKLLWRREAVDVLASLSLDRGLRSKPLRPLWEALSRLPASQLAPLVRETLKRRADWRAVSLQMLRDVKSGLSPT